MPSISTYIGIAFFALEGHPLLSSVILSANIQFEGAVVNATVISGVNGREVSWKECLSLASFAAYLRLVGVIMIAKVDYQMSDVVKSIRSLVWKAEDVRVHSNGPKEACSYDFACRAVLDLCDKGFITLSSNMKNNLDGYITDCLSALLTMQGSRFPIISLKDGTILVGGKLY